MQIRSAINKISLDVLRGNVKPSCLTHTPNTPPHPVHVQCAAGKEGNTKAEAARNGIRFIIMCAVLPFKPFSERFLQKVGAVDVQPVGSIGYSSTKRVCFGVSSPLHTTAHFLSSGYGKGRALLGGGSSPVLRYVFCPFIAVDTLSQFNVSLCVILHSGAKNA